MARENTILADQFNTCLLDEPIPLRVYKDLKKKESPRFRPKSLRDYMRISMNYSNISDTLDKTAYNKEDLEDMMRHWFTEAKRHDYIIEHILREQDEQLGPDWDKNTSTWGEFFDQFSPLIGLHTYVTTPGGLQPPNPIPYPTTESSDDDSQEVVITSQNPDFALPDHLQVVTSSSGNESNGSSSSGNGNGTGYPGGLTSEEYEILVNEFGEEEVFRQFS